MTTVRVDAGTTKFDASPYVIASNRNHVAGPGTRTNWPASQAGVQGAMQSLAPTWGSTKQGSGKWMYRIGHGVTDGRQDPPASSYATGFHYESTFAVDGAAQDLYPYDDIKNALNEAAAMNAQPLMVVNFGTGDSNEAGRLAGYLNQVTNAQRSAKGGGVGPWNVQHFEIGNEISWLNETGHTSKASTETIYAANAAPFIQAIRANSDIPVKCAMVASTNASFFSNWPDNDPGVIINNMLAASNVGGRQQVDAFTLHPYPAYPVVGTNNGTEYANDMAMTTWHQARLNSAMAAINANGNGQEIWLTEFFTNDYNGGWNYHNLLYTYDWVQYAINNGIPIVSRFCMWHQGGVGDNVYFQGANVSAITPLYKWDSVFAKNWGSANLNTTILNPDTYQSTGSASVTVSKLAACSSKSSDGKLLYVMLVNRTIDQSQPFSLELQNFQFNSSQMVTVRTITPSAGWGSSGYQCSVVTSNVQPSASNMNFTVPAGGIVLMTFAGQAVPPNNGTAPPPPPTPTPTPTPTPPPVPINTNPTPSTVPELAAIRELGMNVIEIFVHWNEIEGSKGVRDWTRPDQAVHNASVLGGRIMLTIVGTPQWASGDSSASGMYVNPTSLSDAQSFLTDLATRFQGRVFAYSIGYQWNNPAYYYPSGTDAVRQSNYIVVLPVYGDAIRAVDASALIVLGSIDTVQPNYNNYLSYLYSNSMRTKFDYVNLYAHTGDGSAWDATVPGQLDATRAVMAANGDTSKPLCLQISVGTSPLDSSLQAFRLCRVLSLALLPKWNIAWTNYTPLIDLASDAFKSGLTTSTFQPKQAYNTYRTMSSLFAGKTFVRKMTLGDGNWGLEFTDGKHSTYLLWTSNEATGIPVQLALRSNQVRVVLPEFPKYADAILFDQTVSFSLQKDPMVVIELDPISLTLPATPGGNPTVGGYVDPSRINLNHAKFELSVNGLAYVGATMNWNTANDLSVVTNSWKTTIGSIPYIMRFELDWADMANPLALDNKLNALQAAALIPFVVLRIARSDAPSTKDIANGNKDSDIHAFALKLKALNYPIFFTFEPEFNISTSRACVANGATAVDYTNSWHKIYNIFTVEGVRNVAFVWNPSFQDNPATLANAAVNYYPGDNFTDWIGLTCLFTKTWQDVSSDFNKAMGMGAGKKPIMVTRLGVLPPAAITRVNPDPNVSGLSAELTIELFFDAIERKYTNVKGVLYYNIDKSTIEQYSLSHYPESLGAYAARTVGPRYIESGISLDPNA
jgi:hypothetical protein